jgi:dynein heavy chain
MDALWESDPQELVRKLESCLKLNEAYHEQYRQTKLKLEQTPKGKQFSFNEMSIFGHFDLFCRRVIKLIDMFSTIDQFNSLSKNKLEGMEKLIDLFHQIVKDFRLKRHDLLAYHKNNFDRDYVEFNVKITELETRLQQFINQNFEHITSIEHSLRLLRKFQTILQRESLKSDLDSKLNIIFQNYGLELEQVQQLYEREKQDPPIPRNLPPVAGNITWSRYVSFILLYTHIMCLLELLHPHIYIHYCMMLLIRFFHYCSTILYLLYYADVNMSALDQCTQTLIKKN